MQCMQIANVKYITKEPSPCLTLHTMVPLHGTVDEVHRVLHVLDDGRSSLARQLLRLRRATDREREGKLPCSIHSQCGLLASYHYLQRVLYGVAKAITEHMYKGRGYLEAKKIYSINILYFMTMPICGKLTTKKISRRWCAKTSRTLRLSCTASATK